MKQGYFGWPQVPGYRHRLGLVAALLILILFWSTGSRAAPLDSAANVSAAYGLRQLRASYSGPAIQVRRSSDNALLAIGFDGTGSLDTTALLAFVGSGNGFVATWYDQSGFARNMVQASAALQPFIVMSGSVVRIGGRPAIYASAGTQMAANPASWLVSGNGDRALNAVLTPKSQTVFAVWSGVHSNNSAFGVDLSSFQLYAPYTYGGGDTVSASVAANTTGIVTAIMASGTSSGFLNGAARSTNSTAISTDPTFGLGIGTRPDGIQVDGWYSEIIYFGAAISASGRKSIEQNQGSWFGVTVSAGSQSVSISSAYTTTVVTNGVETINSKALPGATLANSLTVSNLQDSPDQNSIVINLVLPANLDLFVGNLANGAPFAFADGAPGCGFTISFTALSSTTDDVDFLDANDAAITPVADADGFSALVRKLRFRPKGQLGANFGTAPSCTITYRARIR
ncbi:MAG: hypothetical protein NTX28_04550 [Novosphingobium sp.]|nr:hypothetical protein [Novosphingobium sp.]